MAKYPKRKSYQAKGAALAGTPTKYKDHDIAGTDPLRNQFVPTDSNPIRQHAIMAGDPAGDSIGTYLAGKFSKAAKQAEKAVEKPKEDKTNRRQALDKAIEGS